MESRGAQHSWQWVRMWGAKKLLAIQRGLDLNLAIRPVSDLCPGLDPRPYLLLCKGDLVMGLALLWGQKDHAEGTEGPCRGSRQLGENQTESALDFSWGPHRMSTTALG